MNFSSLRVAAKPTVTLILILAMVASYLAAARHKLYLDDMKPVSASVATRPFSDATQVSISAAEAPEASNSQATHVAEGTSVKVYEAHSDAEFSMFALTWKDPKGTNPQVNVHVRGLQSNGSWGAWYDADTLTPTGETPTKGTDLLYVHPTKAVQISFDSTSAPLNDLSDLEMVFIDGKTQKVIAPASYSTTEQLRLIPRAAWGADENLRCQQPTYDNRVTALTIHHTVGANDYSVDAAPGIVRGIYVYHAQTLGWCDIGYQSLVDRFGNIYEGTYGGFDKAVQGAHAGGFNQNTWAISMMGDFRTVAPSNEMIAAVGNLAGWKAFISGFDPLGTSVHYSEGSSYTSIPKGQAVTVHNIFGHRDVDTTECPGDAAYAQLDNIRNLASARYRAMQTGAATTALNIVAAPTAPDPLGNLAGQIGPILGGAVIVLVILFALGVFGSTSANKDQTTTTAAA
ncbi:MAG: N-acetylmuramoyl-L-alanine amidase [Corynebacterium sp.]|nr:N-acetylmuramoyl-L-alanine amidase [Corynebacterium sp.]